MGRKLKTYFFPTFLFIFILLLFITISFSYASNDHEWYLTVFTHRFLYIPFVFYELAIAAILSGILIFFSYFRSRRQAEKIQQALEDLAKGNYYAGESISRIPLEDFKETVVIQNISRDVVTIQQKLIQLSKEVQEYSSQPLMVDQLTKEEILEKERHRLARELHDSVSQQLFAAMMMLSALSEQMKDGDPVIKSQLERVEMIINESQSEMRALLLHLRPVKLEGKSLKDGIVQLLKELRTKIQMKLTWSIEDVSLPKGIEDHLFRIIQELLSNTLRHSKAKELEVYLDQIDQTISLRVLDDGVGFDPNIKKAGSYGLENIRERVSGMGGTCKIISFKNKGTSIEIKIPLVKGSETNDKGVIS
ncbi:sensor histidine kinase [Pisciglobus halotolerans]|uniref:Sensor histidine kinase n=1 Tax=Pisciglobus halotolerans TaxID=745365 RepID=A0A1I3BDZ7_9LACT|nr:sensor histidine kinase [Pisciglobus halotolerans]SFH60535.1 two-component system, NarL family, sensor histidine kinase LiaS [Pisciglobus halotolerans]